MSDERATKSDECPAPSVAAFSQLSGEHPPRRNSKQTWMNAASVRVRVRVRLRMLWSVRG